LVQQQRQVEKAMSSKRANSVDGEGAANARALEIQRRGATLVLKAVTRHFGPEVPTKVTFLWEMMMSVRTMDQHDTIDEAGYVVMNELVICETSIIYIFVCRMVKADELIQCLQVLEVVASSIHLSLHGQVLELLPTLCSFLEHPFRAVRHLASRCLAALGSIDADRVLTTVVERVIPMLGAIEKERMRQGAIDATRRWCSRPTRSQPRTSREKSPAA